MCGAPGEPRVMPGFVSLPPAGSLVPYIIMLVVEGMPLLYLELRWGSACAQGSIGLRTVSPYLSGAGKGTPPSPLEQGGRGFPVTPQ